MPLPLLSKRCSFCVQMISSVPIWEGDRPAPCLSTTAQRLPGRNRQGLSLYLRGRSSWKLPAWLSWTAPTLMSVWLCWGYFYVQAKIMHFLCIVPQDDFVGRTSISSSSVATSLMDDTSPESTVGKKSTKKILLHCNNYVNQAIWKKKKSFLSSVLSICCFEVSLCKLDSFLFFFLPQQRPPCSCPYPRHPSQSGVRPPRGDTPLRRRPRPMFDSFCRPPNTAPSLWWVYAAFPQSSAFHLRWFRPSGRAVQWLALLPHKKMGCGFNSFAWGRLELAGSPGASASVLFWHSGFLPQR